MFNVSRALDEMEPLLPHFFRGGRGIVSMNNKLTSFFVRLSSELHHNSVEVAPATGSTRKIGIFVIKFVKYK